MKKIKKSFFKTSFLLFGASAALLLASTVGSTRAALTYYSENYEMRIEVPSIGVSLVENGNVVGSRNYVGNRWQESGGELLANMLPGENEKLVLGKKYNEALSVRNSGTIDSYVRVILYKNWTKKEEKTADAESSEEKEMEADTELSPDLIKLHLTGNGWIVDEDASTAERTVLYYTSIVPSGRDTAPFSDLLSIDPSIGDKVTETRTTVGGYTTVTTEFAYDGYRFNIKAEADAVQTHNAVEAIRSAWGVDVSIGENGSLSLTRGGTGSTKPVPEQP